jgi:hypothetical protein
MLNISSKVKILKTLYFQNMDTNPPHSGDNIFRNFSASGTDEMFSQMDNIQRSKSVCLLGHSTFRFSGSALCILFVPKLFIFVLLAQQISASYVCFMKLQIYGYDVHLQNILSTCVFSPQILLVHSSLSFKEKLKQTSEVASI